MSENNEQDNKVIDFDRYIDHVTGERDDANYDYNSKSYDFARDADPSRGSTGIWKEEISAHIDMQTLEGLFFSEDWVFICVDLISQKISSQPLAVMKKEIVDGVEIVEFADDHPLNKLIERPNKFQNYYSWMYNYVNQYILMGNAINWYSETLNQIVTLRTSRVTMDFDNDGEITRYLVSQQDDSGFDFSLKYTSFPAEDIVHTARPNIASIIWGLSPFVPGRKSILFNRYSSDYLNSFYLKQATPGMVLEVDSAANEKTVLRSLRTFEMAFTGRPNQRRTLILPKGVKANTSSHSIADQKLEDLIKNNRETILALLKVPKHEVGLQTAGSLGSQEYKVALRNFWESTLIPTMRQIEGSLNHYFEDQLGENYFFKFDLSNVEALQDDLIGKAELATKMLAGGLSINEVRKLVWETDEIEGNEDADKPFILREEKPQFQQFSAPSSTEEKSLESIDTKDIVSLEAQLKSVIETTNKGWIDYVSKQLDDITESKEGEDMTLLALETLTSMAEISLPIIKRNLVTVKDVEISSRSKLRKELTKAFDNFELDYVDTYTNTLKSVVEVGYDQQIELVLDSKDRDKIDTLRQQEQGKRKTSLEARGLDSFAYISGTHTDRIMDQIVAGSEKGESIGKIIERIKSTFTDPEAMLSKAETIGRTETLTAVSVGQAASMQNIAEVIPGTKKAWLNSNDSRVRDAHLDKSSGGVSGEIIPVDEKFSNGLRWPRDLKSGDAGNVINCRCTLITILPGEEVEI